jgi:hypothetical protein
VGHKVGPDDPIDINTKLETLKKLFPGVTISVVANQTDASGQETVGNIFKKIEYELVKQEPFYNNIIITVGSDQAGVAKTADQMQGRYSKFPPLAHVKVSAYVTPRKSDEGGTGVSTTQLRNALKTMPDDQAFQVWSQAYSVQKLGADWIRHLMDVARKNMGIQAKAEPNQAKPMATKQEPQQTQLQQQSTTVAERLAKAIGNKVIVNENTKSLNAVRKVVRFQMSDPDVANIMRNSGIKYINESFEVDQEKYEKILTILNYKFSNAAELIYNKTIAEYKNEDMIDV